MNSRSRTLLVLLLAPLLAGTAVVAGTPLPAHADPSTDAKILLMLDASGSMKEKDPSGLTKLAAAKKALTSAVDNLPANTQVGLRVYGAKINVSKPTTASCHDTQLVHPIGPIDKAGLKQSISSFGATGDTPIDDTDPAALAA